MKTNAITCLTNWLGVALLGITPAFAQLPLIGGADPATNPVDLNITSSTTLPLPPDGVLVFKKITVAANTTLTFQRNALNTTVALLATDEVLIAGTIDTSGVPAAGVAGALGIAGGGDGGRGSSQDVLPQAGFGPGAGVGGRPRGGNASHRTTPAPGGGILDDPVDPAGSGLAFGNSLLIPVEGGSGGSGSDVRGGSSGGGGILVASNVKITIPAGGAILARGARAPSTSDGAGSGGSIRLVAPTVEGGGTLATTGGTLHHFGNQGIITGRAGHGRVRIDTLDAGGIAFAFENGPLSLGSTMIARVTPMPSLSIVEAAGNAIAVGSGPVTIIRPLGSSPDITVKVQAQDFRALVPTQLHATPDAGPRAVYVATIDNVAAGPATTTFSLIVPTNVRVTLQAFAGGSLPTQ